MTESNVEQVPPASDPPVRSGRSDRSPWYWLLIVPVVVPLITSLYNVDSPRLWHIPAFYWLQLLFIVLGVSTTALVYQMTKRRG
jgi:hypothetical protein